LQLEPDRIRDARK